MLLVAALAGFYFFRPPSVTVAGMMTRDTAPAIQGEANVRTAEAQLRDLLAGPRPLELEQMRARLASATATRTLAEHDYQRAEELSAKELISAQGMDRARQAYDVATAAERDVRHAARRGGPCGWGGGARPPSPRRQDRAGAGALADPANDGRRVRVTPAAAGP